MYSKRKFKKVITLRKDPKISVHRMEVGRHGWYSSFCDADTCRDILHKLKCSFKPEGDKTGRTD